MGLIKAGMGALGGTLQKDKNVSPDVQRTPKEMTILSRTALELL